MRERRAKAPRRSRRDGAGEAQLLQLAQSTPPAGQARGTLRALARAREARGIVPRIRYETVRCTLKNELTPWRRIQRRYPPVRAADFVAPMKRCGSSIAGRTMRAPPVICRDEQPKQLRADKRTPRPARPGRPATYDYAYVRHGSCTVWLFVEPRGPWRTAHATARRTGVDWAHLVKVVADHPRYRQVERLTRVCDHWNPHTYASFYRAFPPARRCAWPSAYGWCLRPSTAAGSTGPNRN